jgi:hypothetical protein
VTAGSGGVALRCRVGGALLLVASAVPWRSCAERRILWQWRFLPCSSGPRVNTAAVAVTAAAAAQ